MPDPVGERRVVLRSSTRQTGRLVLTSLVLTAASAYDVATDGQPVWLGWVGVVFFGLGVVLFLARLAVPGRLEIDADGFCVHQLGRTVGYRWPDVGNFRVYSVSRRTATVAFDDMGRTQQRRPRLSSMNRHLAGANAALPETYGLPAMELALLLEHRRQQETAVSDRPRTP